MAKNRIQPETTTNRKPSPEEIAQEIAIKSLKATGLFNGLQFIVSINRATSEVSVLILKNSENKGTVVLKAEKMYNVVDFVDFAMKKKGD